MHGNRRLIFSSMHQNLVVPCLVLLLILTTDAAFARPAYCGLAAVDDGLTVDVVTNLVAVHILVRDAESEVEDRHETILALHILEREMYSVL
jgi:hypothetical protein